MIDGASQLNTNSHPFVCGGDFTAYTQIYAPNMSTGTVTGYGVFWSSGTLIHGTSSLRYKTNVQDAWYGLKEVLSIRPVTYQGKVEKEQGNNETVGGFIAEEIDAAGLKEFVVYNEDGEPDALRYDMMVSLMAAAIKELNAKIEALEAKVG